jgi:hypothetical protein
VVVTPVFSVHNTTFLKVFEVFFHMNSFTENEKFLRLARLPINDPRIYDLLKSSRFIKQQEELSLPLRDDRCVSMPEFLGRMRKDAGFMAGKNDPDRVFTEAIDGCPRFVNIGKEISIPGSETGEIVITGKKDGRFSEKKGKVAGGMSRSCDDIYSYIAELDRFSADQKTGRAPRPEMKLIKEQRFPKASFIIGKTIPVHKNGDIRKRRHVFASDPEGEIVEEVKMHEVILVPVAEPHHLNPLFGAQPYEPFPIRGRINENSRPLNIEGVAEGITSPIIAGQKADRTEQLLFHGYSPRVAERND